MAFISPQTIFILKPKRICLKKNTSVGRLLSVSATLFKLAQENATEFDLLNMKRTYPSGMAARSNVNPDVRYY